MRSFVVVLALLLPAAAIAKPNFVVLFVDDVSHPFLFL
jgi:hypothetical protein